mgnify:CR=1 FL=1
MAGLFERFKSFTIVQFRLGFFAILLILISSSCSPVGGHDELIVARAGTQYLKKSDLLGVVPNGLSSKDSLLFVKRYIDNWAREEILMEQAIFNQIDSAEEIEDLVEHYRRSLLKQRYIAAYVKQNVDTLVTNDQLDSCYQNNLPHFTLRETIVRLRYIKVSKMAPKLEELIERLEIGDADDKEWLEEYSFQFSRRHYFKDDQWTALSDIAEQLPLKEFKKNLILEEKGVLQFEDKEDLYLLKIVDYAIKDEISPLAFVKDRVRSLILHQRKLEITNELEENLFQQALKEDKFELYYENNVD